MTPIKRRVAAVSAPVLLALSLTACGGGGGSSAPADASSDDFCKVLNSNPEALSSADAGEAADAAHEYADNLTEVGTPDTIDGEAREGYEILVSFLSDVSSGDIEKFNNQDASDVFNEDELKKIEAFGLAAGTECGVGDLGDLQS